MTQTLRIADVCERLGVVRDTVYDYVRRGYLKPNRTPTGQYLFDPDEVEALRLGERPETDASPSTPDENVTKEKPSRAAAWTELAPWKAKVEATRAALEVDDLEFEREERAIAREQKREALAESERQRARDDADWARIANLKRVAISSAWVPFEYRAAVVRALEQFTTPAQVPAYLNNWAQLQLLYDKISAVVKDLSEATRERHELERRKKEDEQRKVDEQERTRAREIGERIAAAVTPPKVPEKSAEAASKPVSAPRSVAEALKRRRG